MISEYSLKEKLVYVGVARKFIETKMFVFTMTYYDSVTDLDDIMYKTHKSLKRMHDTVMKLVADDREKPGTLNAYEAQVYEDLKRLASAK
jgi:hypothetical protein